MAETSPNAQHDATAAAEIERWTGYIYIRSLRQDEAVFRTLELEDGINLDLDEQGGIIGIESLWNFSLEELFYAVVGRVRVAGVKP